MTTLLVAVAGAVGCCPVPDRDRRGVRPFPWRRLASTSSGWFLLAAVLAGPAASRWSPATTTAFAVGLLGAYTTFGYETLTLLRAGRTAAAAG